MKIDIIEMTPTKAQFVITDANPAFANALRRTLTADVPKMAIDNVEFHLGPIGDTKLRIKDDLIPIVKLSDDQALLVYATAELGTGKQHAKWQAAIGAGYRYFAKIEIDQAKCDVGGSCVKVCPKGVLRKEDKKIVVKHP